MASTFGAAFTSPLSSANVAMFVCSALWRKYPHPLQMDEPATFESPHTEQ
jgi:hypothetical protein